MIFMLYSFAYHFYQDEQPSGVPRLKNKINQSLERSIKGRVGVGFDIQWYFLKPQYVIHVSSLVECALF